MRHSLMAFALLFAVRPALAQTNDADFEAALRANVPSPRVTAAAGAPSAVGFDRFVGQSSMERPAAPRGTIPVRFRTLEAMPKDGVDLQTEVSEGRLDPLALMEQISGPLPLPPGALPISCGRTAGTVLYTMGVDLSAAFAELDAKARRGRAELQDVLDMAANEAKPIRDRLRPLFIAQGFREITSQGRRIGFFNAARQLKVYVEDTSGLSRRDCLDMPKPIELPTGPTLRFTHDNELGLTEHLIDTIPAPTGQRVTHPFG